MDRERPSTSQGDRSGRNVRRRLIPPPPIQVPQQPSTLREESRGSSGLPHGLQSLTGSTSAQGRERHRSLRSARHFRVSPVFSEVPQSTYMHLRSSTLSRGSRTHPQMRAIHYYPVILAAPSSRLNLVDSATDHSRDQNPEILTSMHPALYLDIDRTSYEQLLQLEEMNGRVSRGIKKSEIHEFVKTIICCGEQDKDEICVICQEQYVDEDVMGQLKCSHLYHMSCIGDWMQENAICPVCRGRAARF